LPELPEPSFIDRDVAAVTADLVAIYEQMTGKTLLPAQPERIFIDLVAYREMLLRIAIQQAGLQNLVAFASGIMLDYLGELVGCTRLPEQPARTTIEFTLTSAQSFDVLVAGGVEIQSKDGKWSFLTDAPLTIPAGEVTGAVTATADAAGIGGNGYLAGEVNDLAAPVAFVQSAANTTVTVGGADAELDDRYRERIKKAPNAFSTAGPSGAYKFWAQTAHPDIVDVAAISPSAGVVNIYPLMRTGLPSAEILALVESVLTDTRRRPLTDHVQALVPTEVNFAIVANVTLYQWYAVDAATAKANLETMLAAYAAELRGSLGNDLVCEQIKGKLINSRGVYNVELTGPAADQVLTDDQWLNCTSITVNIVGYARG
jgi:phage-related baseplate assembly protein